MTVLLLTVAWFPVCAIPGALLLWFTWRAPPQRDSLFSVWGTFALGVALAWPATMLEGLLATITDTVEQVQTLGSGGAFLFLFLFAAPLEEGLKVAGAWPAFRSRHFDEQYDGLLYATASAAGYASGEAALRLAGEGAHPSHFVKVLLVLLAQPLLSSLWGFSLGRVRRSKVPTSSFLVLWITATVLHAMIEHLAASHSVPAMASVVPLLGALAFVRWWITRDLLRKHGRATLMPFRLPSGARASIMAIRQELTSSERPIRLYWIPLGALVTTGVMIVSATSSIVLGRRLGLDFSLIDRTEGGSAVLVPLIMLAVGVLVAFPISGYLIARASRSDTVTAPALSAALAIVVVLIMLGLAAPTALILALAFAPVAFGFACAGAWVGVGR